MVLTLYLLALIVLVGVILTVFAWPSRHHPKVFRRLMILWIGIVLTVPILLMMVPLGIVVGAYEVYQWLVGFLKDLGLPDDIAHIVACLGAVPLLYALCLALKPFSFSKTRWFALGSIGLLFAALMGIGYWQDASGSDPFAHNGRAKQGIVYLSGNRVKVCGNPGKIDPATGLSCLPMTPAMFMHLDPSTKVRDVIYVKIEDPETFYDPNGKPNKWVCVSDEGRQYFVWIPDYIEPTTGKACVPVSVEVIRQYRKKQHTEAERKVKEARLVAEREAAEQVRQQEQRLAEDKRRVQEDAQRRIAEDHRRNEEMMRQLRLKREEDEQRARAWNRAHEPGPSFLDVVVSGIIDLL